RDMPYAAYDSPGNNTSDNTTETCSGSAPPDSLPERAVKVEVCRGYRHASKGDSDSDAAGEAAHVRQPGNALLHVCIEQRVDPDDERSIENADDAVRARDVRRIAENGLRRELGAKKAKDAPARADEHACAVWREPRVEQRAADRSDGEDNETTR